jgi:GT2 family glycosyltransferase
LLVSIIIPTWNRTDLLGAVLASLGHQTLPNFKSSVEVLVVDNGSRDNSAALAEEWGARVIRFDENAGFARAVNAGIGAAGGEWILILNNDVTLAPDYLMRLLDEAARTGSDFAAGKILMANDHRTLEGSFDLVSRGGYAWRCGYGHRDGELWSQPRRILWAPMTAALFHRRLFESLGALDVSFGSYYEDVDFGLRCAEAGFQGAYVPDAVVFHVGSATFGKRSARVYYWSARNQVLLLAKHLDGVTALRGFWPILVGQTLALLAGAKHGHFLASAIGKLAALGPALRELMRPKAHAADAYRILQQSEREIHDLQSALGFDLYWRIYFMLTGRSRRV